MKLSMSALGMGITKTRNRRGNRAALYACKPYERMNPPLRNTTAASAMIAVKSFWLRPVPTFRPTK